MNIFLKFHVHFLMLFILNTYVDVIFINLRNKIHISKILVKLIKEKSVPVSSARPALDQPIQRAHEGRFKQRIAATAGASTSHVKP